MRDSSLCLLRDIRCLLLSTVTVSMDTTVTIFIEILLSFYGIA